MGGTMISKSLIQFSVDGWGCIPSLLFDLRPNFCGSNKDNGDLLQKVPCTHCSLSAPNPAAGHYRPTPPPETLGGHNQNLVCTGTYEKGAVSPQETDPDLPVSVQESPAEAWVGGGLLQGWGH